MKKTILILLILSTLQAQAATLQQLAEASNILLVWSEQLLTADTPSTKKHCGIKSFKDIMSMSQRLKSQIDEKIKKLSAGDLQILQKRSEICQKDCSCDINALALESHQMNSSKASDKAQKTTMAEREACVQKIKNICKHPVVASLLNKKKSK